MEDRKKASIRSSFKYAVVWSATGEHMTGASLTNESTKKVNELLERFFEAVSEDWFDGMSNKDIGTDLFFELYGSPGNWKGADDETRKKITEVCDGLPEIHCHETADPRYIRFHTGM